MHDPVQAQHQLVAAYQTSTAEKEAMKQMATKTQWKETPDSSMPSHRTSFVKTTRATHRNSNQPPMNTVRTAICHCCDESGHISKHCPQLNTIAKNDWFVKCASGAYQEPNSTVGSDDEQSQVTTRATRAASSAPPANDRSGACTGNTQRTGNWQGFQFFNLQTDLSPIPAV